MNQEFYKNVYQSSRPKVAMKKEKQTLIIDTGETTDTSSFDGRSGYNVKEIAYAGNGAANKLHRFIVTLKEPLLISSRCYVKLDNVIISNINQIVETTSSTQSHTINSHVFKVKYPGIKHSSLLSFSVNNFNIKNVSNKIQTVSNIFSQAFILSKSTLLSLNSSQKAYPQTSVQSLTSSKYDILGIINPVNIKSIQFDVLWGSHEGDGFSDSIFSNSTTDADKNRIVFEFMFEPI